MWEFIKNYFGWCRPSDLEIEQEVAKNIHRIKLTGNRYHFVDSELN